MNEITDYGDKIGGAKKDLFSDHILRLTSQIDENDPLFGKKSLSDMFPKPDYADLAEKGISHVCLAAMCAMRSQIGRKPTANRDIKDTVNWLKRVKFSRNVAVRILQAEQGPETDAALTRAVCGHSEVSALTFRAFLNVPPEKLNKVEKLSCFRRGERVMALTEGRKILFDSQRQHRDAPLSTTLKAAAAAMLAATDKAPAAKKAKTDAQKMSAVLRTIKIYHDHAAGHSIEIRNTRGSLMLKTGLKSLAEARAWFSAHRQDVKDKISAYMRAPAERTGDIRDRQGPARRRGDVAKEALAQKFGLRSIEFGNYVEPTRRQQDLNAMWDSMSDLAEALEIPADKIGAFGALAIAFGSRGGGRAMAHYEPDRRVFNLTKNSGAGSTAHEWFHSVDNAATMQNPSDKQERSPYMISQFAGPEQTVLATAWAGYERRMSGLDAMSTKTYWAKPEEMAARCFEVWLVNALAEQGIRNDHLVEIDRHSEAYPTPAEMVLISPAIETLARVIMAKITPDIEPDVPDFDGF